MLRLEFETDNSCIGTSLQGLGFQTDISREACKDRDLKTDIWSAACKDWDSKQTMATWRVACKDWNSKQTLNEKHVRIGIPNRHLERST